MRLRGAASTVGSISVDIYITSQEKIHILAIQIISGQFARHGSLRTSAAIAWHRQPRGSAYQRAERTGRPVDRTNLTG